MKTSFFISFSFLALFFVSCKKDDNNNDNPLNNSRDWFKLRTILSTTQYVQNIGSSNYFFRDSFDIQIDSVNNKIIRRFFDLLDKDSTTETFSYNSKNQLVLIEKVSTIDWLFISRMEFVRDADGKVTKVLSEYKNSLIPRSEGTLTYDKRGDTTFVTFVDSLRKIIPSNYYDGDDYYQVGLVGDKVVSEKVYYDYNGNGRIVDTIQTKYEYDAAGNIATEIRQTNSRKPVVYTYQRGSESPRELQKFLAQLAGDLLWFHRAKLFSFSNDLASVNTVAGNVLLSKSKDGAVVQPFTNAFDANGNLSWVNWETESGTSTIRMDFNEKYYYRP